MPVYASIRNFHLKLVNDLFGDNTVFAVKEEIEQLFTELLNFLKNNKEKDYNRIYDTIVGYGELVSTKILHFYLKKIGLENKWIDIRNHLITDFSFREGNILWLPTNKRIKETFLFDDTSLYVTQGFIAATLTKQPTTLGREGSDFTAAILAFVLNAESVTTWKDVDGIYTADPKQFDDYERIPHLSYHETIELSYFGAQVIHPKTIKPLQNKQIPLFVKSFYAPENVGTLISDVFPATIPPVVILKHKQILVSISPKDFSFIVEEHISLIFSMLADRNIKVNLFQHGAISISLVIDDKYRQFDNFVQELQENFKVLFNRDLTLLTIRHYTEEKLNELTQNRKIYIEQLTRKTARFVIKW
jgi:aspartate kinase